MKSNIILSTVSLAASLLLVGGCYSLDLYPDNELSDGTFWQTPEHAREAIVGVYSILPNNNVCGELYLEDALGTIGACTDHDICDIITGNYNSSSSFILKKWSTLYEGIARANIVIRNVRGMSAIDSATKTAILGEARFLRGFFYNMLMNYWGAVPYYDETWVIGEKFAEMKEPRMAEEQLREKILADLDYAITFLPEEWSANDYGRATKGAAQALKGKVLLYAKQYYEAASVFESLIESGHYALDTSYSNIFKPEGDAGNEMIFSVQNISMCGNMGNLSSFGKGMNKFTLNPDFVDSYDYLTGTSFDWDLWYPDFTTDNTVKQEAFLLRDSTTFEDPTYPKGYFKLMMTYNLRDARMGMTAILPYSSYSGWYNGNAVSLEYLVPAVGTGNEEYGSLRVNNSHKAYLFRKFVPEGDSDGINFPIIRYADVLLMYAECLNEIDYRVTAVKYLNLVRSRAGMASVSSSMTKDEAFDAIRHEREVELAGEGHSYMDLKRWGLLDQLNEMEVTDIIGETQYVHKVSERDYHFPIPASEIKLNPALEQNEGW